MGSTDPKGEAGRPERMPSAADVARIPEPVRAHALAMLQLGAAAREARTRWCAFRDRYKAWSASQPGQVHYAPRCLSDEFILAVGGPNELAAETIAMWQAELAQEQGAAVYRAQLAENNARPTADRWSPTNLALWARCSIAGQKPA